MNSNKNHELLCALVLGELPPGADREHIEAALAESAELRAEKERIESTIGIVAQAFEGDAKLSANAADRLLAAAQHGPVAQEGDTTTLGVVRPAGLHLLEDHDARTEGWRGRDSLRAAAGFVLFLGVAFAGYKASGGGESESFEGDLALLEPVDRSASRFEIPLDRAGQSAVPITDPRVARADAEPDLSTVDLRGFAPSDPPVDSPGSGLDDQSMSVEEGQLQAKLAEINSQIADSSATARLGSATITHLERTEAEFELGEVLKSVSPPPASKASPTPAAPRRAKGKMRKSKKRSQTPSLQPVGGVDARLEDSTVTVGAVLVAPEEAESDYTYRKRLTVDEDADELALGVRLVDPEFGLEDESKKLRFETQLAATEKEVVFALGGLQPHGGRYRGPIDSYAEFSRSYLGQEPLDFEGKVELAKRIALEPFTPRPGESPRTLYTRFYGENPFVEAREDALSTFGIDVDDASWLRSRASLRGGSLPDPRTVRVEEFVNAFRPDVPAPTNGETFAVAFEAIPERFGDDPNRVLLRVALRGKEVTPFERKPLQLTFVVDVSGSMDESNRLPLVKETLALLVDQLGSGDSISIVSFADEAKIVQPMVPAANRTQILAAIDSLESEGGTNAEAGLVTGYEVAAAQVAQGITSRVVLLSDGIANMGETDQARLTDRVAKERESGVFLNTVGVGLEPGGDAFLEQLADRGDGLATWMQDAEGARRSLIENFTGAFETIARDVKIQVEFDPQQTGRWRQLGYENRAIADQDFRNDKVDAGEVGAGHQIVALYELELAGGLKFNRLPGSGENLATVRVRWKNPEGAEVQEIEHSADFSSVVSWEGASAGMKRSVIAARFAEVLRRSKHARSIQLLELEKYAEELSLYEGDPDLIELRELIGLAGPLVEALPEPDAELEPLFEALRDNALRKARYQLDHPVPPGEAQKDSLKGPRDDDPAWIDLGRERQDLEQRLADVLRKRLESLNSSTVPHTRR